MTDERDLLADDAPAEPSRLPRLAHAWFFPGRHRSDGADEPEPAPVQPRAPEPPPPPPEPPKPEPRPRRRTKRAAPAAPPSAPPPAAEPPVPEPERATTDVEGPSPPSEEPAPEAESAASVLGEPAPEIESATAVQEPPTPPEPPTPDVIEPSPEAAIPPAEPSPEAAIPPAEPSPEAAIPPAEPSPEAAIPPEAEPEGAPEPTFAEYIEIQSPPPVEAAPPAPPPAPAAPTDGQSVPVVDTVRLHLRGVLEALIFASAEPMSARDLARLAKAEHKIVKELLVELRDAYQHRGFRLDEVAGGYAFRTSPAFAPFVRELVAKKPVRMSRAQLETLAIVAYKQPITRPEIDDIRGVDSGPVLKSLLERGFVRILGKKEDVGRPMLYGTTSDFLEFFGLKAIADLPTLREFTELSDDSRRAYEREMGEEPPEDGATVSMGGLTGEGDLEMKATKPRPEDFEDPETPAPEASGEEPAAAATPQEGDGEAGEEDEDEDAEAEAEDEDEDDEDEDEDEDEEDEDDEDEDDEDDEEDEDDEDDEDEDEDDEDEDEEDEDDEDEDDEDDEDEDDEDEEDEDDEDD